MATFKNIPGSGYGNPYVDSLIWGGNMWDQSQEPILISLAGENDYDEAVQVHGEINYLHSSAARGVWYPETTALMVDVLGLFTSVANIRLAEAPTVSDANIALWWYPLEFGVSGWHESPIPFIRHPRTPTSAGASSTASLPMPGGRSSSAAPGARP